MDELALIKASRTGDRAAFGGLVDLYYKNIYRLAYRYMGCHAEADDICQETFLRALEKIGTLRDGRCFKAWLLKIALNLSHRDLEDSEKKAQWT